MTWRARARNTIVSVVVLTPFTGDACGGRVFVVMIIINAFYFHVTDNRFPGGVEGRREAGEAAVMYIVFIPRVTVVTGNG